ncbi:MAG TPA: hypothetical protein VN817_05075, partial [Solirubrobacteraceae bacterium]|nr:hypothetical protein [Solirubrobacteraceae bacterium]
MDAWTFVWLMVFLKIPIVGLFLIVRWAVRQTPETAPGADGGVGPRTSPRHPHHPRAPRTRRPATRGRRCRIIGCGDHSRGDWRADEHRDRGGHERA